MMRTAQQAAEKPMPGDRWKKKTRTRHVDELFTDDNGVKRLVYSGNWCCLPEVTVKAFRRWCKTATFLGGGQ